MAQVVDPHHCQEARETQQRLCGVVAFLAAVEWSHSLRKRPVVRSGAYYAYYELGGGGSFFFDGAMIGFERSYGGIPEWVVVRLWLLVLMECAGNGGMWYLNRSQVTYVRYTKSIR